VTLADRPWVLATALGYVALTFAIGVWALRRTRGPRDYFIAGQRAGVFAIGVATMSAAFSGFLFLGGPGLTYRIGVGALFIVVPLGFTSGLLCWTVGKRLRLLAEVHDVYTIPDAIALRYRSPAAHALASLTVAVGAVGYLGAQFLALGVLVRTALGIDSLALALALGVVVVVAYSVAGGMLAGLYTDVFQGAVMLVAAVAVFRSAVASTGGWGELTASLAASPEFGASFLEPFGRIPVHAAFGFFFVFGVGVLGQPQMLHKFYMLRDPRALRYLPLALGGSQALCVLLWIGIGLAVPALVAQGRLAPLANPDLATPTFLLQFAPALLAGLALAGALAAIMSTSDSFLNIGAAALVRDLPRAFGRSARESLAPARAATVLIALAAALLAGLYGDLIALIGTFAFGTFAAGLAPALAVGLNWKRVTASAATASIATGTGLNLTLELLARQTVLPWLPKLPLAPGVPVAAVAIAASFAVLLVVSRLTGDREREPEIDDGVRAIMEA
jgi:Na+/proline symporter